VGASQVCPSGHTTAPWQRRPTPQWPSKKHAPSLGAVAQVAPSRHSRVAPQSADVRQAAAAGSTQRPAVVGTLQAVLPHGHRLAPAQARLGPQSASA
jgi:hypothetical protein